MTMEFLLQWWNLIFVVPFLLALLYLAVFVFSGITFGDGDVDADADLDADADADADVSAEPDADADAEAQADVHGEVGAGGAPAYLVMLSWLGLGKLPLSLLLMVLLMSWGIIGLAANSVLRTDFRQTPGLLAMIPLPLAAAGSLLVTALLSRLMGRFLPLGETYARRRHELLGLVGEALYPIDRDFGMAFVRDDRGEVFQVPCRLCKDGQPIDKGTRICLVGYNGKLQVYYVRPHESARAEQ